MRYLYLSVIILFFFVSGSYILQAQGEAHLIASIEPRADQLEKVKLPFLDNERLRQHELAQQRKGRPPHFAEAVEVNISPNTHGRWDKTGDRSVWRLRLQSPEAYSLNLGFGRYHMPEGGRLIIYNISQDRVMGPFTPSDNEDHEQLWTPIFPGDELVVEVQLPTRRRDQLELRLDYVNHDFMDFQNMSSGPCNLDIACGSDDGWPQVDPFRDAARSVGVYSLNGRLICSGFLVNNTRNDCTPYFMTANHCDVRRSTAASMVIYWNYQNSYCRQPDSQESGQAGDGRLSQFNTGAQLRARWSTSDFALVELDDPVNENAQAYFAGWSAEDIIPQGMVATVHHAFTQEKRISLSTEPLYTTNWPSSQPIAKGTHLIVPKWTVGTTQTGSSGAPLFDKTGRVIGQLQGGEATCEKDDFDSFGRFHTSWEGGMSPDTRLKDWLDPDQTGLLAIAGREQDRCDFYVSAFLPGSDLCPGQIDTALIIPGNGFSDSLRFSFDTMPEGIVAELLQETTAPEDTALIQIIADQDVIPGTYLITGSATDGEQSSPFELRLIITQPISSAPLPVAPADQATGQDLQPYLIWAPIPEAEHYELRISYEDGDNEQIIHQEITPDTLLWLPDLLANTSYSWQVRAINPCGTGEWSSPQQFTTADWTCEQVSSTHPPLTIADNEAGTVSSTLEITIDGLINSVEVANLNIEHFWVGDLQIILRAPSGKEIVLLDRAGYPASLYGCDGSNLQLNFNQNSLEVYDVLENTCRENPALTGTFQPLQSFSAFEGEKAAGEWTLIVNDMAEQDGGELVGWELNVCTQPESVPLLLPLENDQQLCSGDSLFVDLAISSEFAGAAVLLAADELPPGSQIAFSANPATPGDTVQLVLSSLSAPGEYSVFLEANDGQTVAITDIHVTVIASPQPVLALSPPDESVIADPAILFSWQADAAADSYRLEIAGDTTFSQPLLAVSVTDTTYMLTNELGEAGAFYWRITAIGECGEAVSATSRFRFQTTATTWLDDQQQVRVFPNPFHQNIAIDITQPLVSPLRLRLMDLTGRTIGENQMLPGVKQLQWQLTNIPPGVYILEMSYRGKRYSQKLIRQ